MSTVTTFAAADQPAAGAGALFCDRVLPAVLRHARFVFRHLRCPQAREDAVQEAVALVWKWHVRLAARGKDSSDFPGALAAFAARHVHAGRKLVGKESGKDALSPTARRRRGFKVESLPSSPRLARECLYSSPTGQEAQDAFEERLRDNTQSPVPDQAAFRIDFPEWLGTLSDRDRRAVELLSLGHGTGRVARLLGISPARVSQLRRELCAAWQNFHNEVA